MNEPYNTAQLESYYSGPRTSLDDTLAASKFVESLARHFGVLHQQFEAEMRSNQELQTKFNELELLHFNSMRAARSEQPLRRIPMEGRPYPSSRGYGIPYSDVGDRIPHSDVHADIKEIQGIRQRSDELEKAQNALYAARKYENRLLDLYKRLERATWPASGLLRSTRRAIARILERHRKATAQIATD